MDKMSLKTKNYIGSIMGGLFWFLSGLFSLWDTTGFHIASMVSTIGAIVSMWVTMIVQVQDGDEMSEAHFLKAKARTFDSVLITFLIFVLFSSLYKLIKHEDFIVNWQSWLMMFIGFMIFTSGLYFAKFERDGD